jgi:hypothetical protein
MASTGFDKRTIGTVLLVLVVACSVIVSAALAAPPPDRGSSKSAQPRAVQSSGAEKSPAKQCKAERAALGAQAFAEKYGTNANLRNAFGKCVSGTARGTKPAKR